MRFETAFRLVCEVCPGRLGMLWDTTDHSGCDTAWAVADQYADDEVELARQALELLATGRIPDDWQKHAEEQGYESGRFQ